MADATSPGKTQAEIPQSIVEYTAVFSSPIEKLDTDRIAIIASVLEALKPWGFSIDGVEVKTQGEKLSEHNVIFRRTKPATPAMSLSLFFGKIFVSAANLDWEGADTFIAAVKAGVDAIREITKPQIQSQHIAVGIHIQLKNRSRLDVMAPMLADEAKKLLDGELTFPGIIVNREKSSIIIEASIPYANGLFVRIFREHKSGASFEEMATALRNDEMQLYEVLGLEGIL